MPILGVFVGKINLFIIVIIVKILSKCTKIKPNL